MTTGKTIALSRQTFVGKVMSLVSNMLYRLVITFLPRSKRLLISWLQSPSAVILEPKKIKLELTPKTDVPFILEGRNDKVGNQEIPGVTGKFGFGVQNETGQRLTEFCQENTLIIASTLFQ